MKRIVTGMEEWLIESVWHVLAGVFGFTGILMAIIFFATYRSTESERQWCRDHDYAIAGVSSGAGKFRLNEIVCLDDQRRIDILVVLWLPP